MNSRKGYMKLRIIKKRGRTFDAKKKRYMEKIPSAADETKADGAM